MGLSGFFLKFDDETAREAVVKAWGTPAIDANWKVWTDPASHTQAAFTECGYASYSGSTPIGKRTCTLELMPMQTVDELVQTLFPNRRSRVGATSMGEDFIGRPFKSDDDELTEFLLPLPASFYTRVEIKLDSENRILAYRTELSYGADSTRATYLGALAAVLGPDAKNVARQGCAETKLDRTPVLTCDFERSLVVTVGDWKGR